MGKKTLVVALFFITTGCEVLAQVDESLESRIVDALNDCDPLKPLMGGDREAFLAAFFKSLRVKSGSAVSSLDIPDVAMDLADVADDVVSYIVHADVIATPDREVMLSVDRETMLVILVTLRPWLHGEADDLDGLVGSILAIDLSRPVAGVKPAAERARAKRMVALADYFSRRQVVSEKASLRDLLRQAEAEDREVRVAALSVLSNGRATSDANAGRTTYRALLDRIESTNATNEASPLDREEKRLLCRAALLAFLAARDVSAGTGEILDILSSGWPLETTRGRRRLADFVASAAPSASEEVTDAIAILCLRSSERCILKAGIRITKALTMVPPDVKAEIDSLTKHADPEIAAMAREVRRQ